MTLLRMILRKKFLNLKIVINFFLFILSYDVFSLESLPIIISGASDWNKTPLTHFRLLSHKNKKINSIAFQIDEKNLRNEYVLDQGIPFTKNSDDGLWDENDELVFYSDDLGKKFPQSEIEKIKKTFNAEIWTIEFHQDQNSWGEIVLLNISDSEKLKLFDKNFPRQEENNVAFDAVQNQITTSYYQYTFNKKSAVTLGEVFFRQNDQWFPFIKKSNWLFHFTTPFWMPNMNMSEQDFDSSVECWQTGPIRSIIAVGVKYQSFLSVFKLHLFSELVFYRRSFQIPTSIDFPFDAQNYLSFPSGIAYSIKLIDEFKLQSNIPKFSVKPNLNESPQKSYVVTFENPQTQMQLKVDVDTEGLDQPYPPFILEKHDLTFTVPPLLPHWLQPLKDDDLGILIDFSKAKKGSYQFKLDMMMDFDSNRHLPHLFYDAILHNIRKN